MLKQLFRLKSSIHFDYNRDLKKYICNLRSNTRLGFLTESSYNRTFADTVIVFNEVKDYVLLKASPISSSMKEIIDEPESREDLAIRCVQDETGLIVTSVPLAIGIPKKVKNSHPDPKVYGKDFFKHTMIVTEFESLISKSKPLIWVKRKLITTVFVDETIIPHPQVYAYNDLMLYCSLRKVVPLL